jgi:GT2 family glycosyltransferase/glycosyltransferase involved in cell wall biosynthesis
VETGDYSKLYDAYYYAHDCGKPYQRDADWLSFFDRIAERLIAEIQPNTVLDAGCAMGFLVEALRRRGVAAYGVDISEYAIQNVHVDIQPYCWVGSVTAPFPQKYDLIVSIEVLEHMPKQEAEQAIVNFCNHADDIVFSSTPFDYREVTHVNVQNPEYWAGIFARQGFFRDQDFDASFLTPWAVRFRRHQDPLYRIVQDYERRFWTLWKENVDLRDLSTNLSTNMRLQQREADKTIRQLTTQKDNLKARLTGIENSMGWIFLQKLQSLRVFFFRPGSKRDQRLETFIESVRVHRLGGALANLLKDLKNRLLFWRTPKLSDYSLGRGAYQSWITAHEPSAAALAEQKSSVQKFSYRPLISLVMPVYNPPLAILRETLNSVLMQTYDGWELCIANGSSVPGVKTLLDEFALQDDRILVSHLAGNLGISGNSNEALGMARGEFVALLDHDDALAPNMLYEVVGLLNKHAQADIIYFDEDKVLEDKNVRTDPFFKPDWSPHLLLSVNYLTHAVFRRDLVLEVGGFNSTMDGAQDWDLAFRCTEKTNHIFHIPKILYHWRKMQTSTAQAVETAKPWAYEAQVHAVQAHLQRVGEQGAKVILSDNLIRILWPHSGRKVSIIIPTKNKADLLMACLSSILELTAYPDYEIILVDNDSNDASIMHYYKLLQAEPRVKIVPNPGAFNYSAANNLGAKHATGDVLLFLNNDTQVVDADWLDELVAWAERPNVGIVGAKLVRPDGTIQHAGIIMGMIGHCAHVFDGGSENVFTPFGLPEWYRDYKAVTGACMMMRRDVHEQLGPFDETYIIGYSDIEMCLRAIEAQYTVIYTPFARLLHHEGASRGLFVSPSDVLRVTAQMWPYIESGDAYYNPNLTYANRVPTLVQADEENNEGRLIALLEALGVVKKVESGRLAAYSAATSGFITPWVKPAASLALEPRHDYRLMFVTHDLSLSGAPIVLAMLAQYLTSVGFDVTVYSPTEGPLREKFQQVGIEVVVVSDLLTDALRASEIVTRYDGVVANTIMTWQVIHAARAFQKPSLWWIHESMHGIDWASREHVVATAFSETSAVVFATQTTADLYRSILRGSDYFIIPYGVDMTEGISDEVRVDIPKPPGKFCVVHAGSVEPRKGQDVLLDAVLALPREVKRDMVVYFLGRVLDQGYYAKLKQLVQQEACVQFVGEVSYERFLRYLEIADTFVLTSRDEVLPMTLLTAMGYGKPIISTTVGGVAEVIENGVHGLLIQSEDVIALKNGLVRLVKSPDLARRLGSAALHRFEDRLTVERFGQAMLDVLDRIGLQK